MIDELDALRELIADVAASDADASETWAKLRELGLDAIGVPEEAGGSGGTLAHLAVIVDALGEAGLSVPILEVATARWVLAQAGSGTDAAMPIVVLADSARTSHVVPWGRNADLLIVYGAEGPPRAYSLDEASVVISEGTNVAGEPRDIIELGEVMAQDLPKAPSEAALRARMGLLWASALTGALRGAYHKTREHVSAREQFGAALIKLPAVAASIANFKTHLILTEAATARALDAVVDDEDAALAAVASARIVAASSATEGARLAHQLHGAMGFTHEDGLHRLTTKLWAWQDADTSEREWSILLGEKAIEGGEESLWAELSAAF